MAITFEETAIAWARLLIRAEQAEARVVELEAVINKLKDATNETAK